MGEGRGHAARARAMVERLRGEHRIVLFTSHDALAFLQREYDGDPEIDVYEIPGIVFHYTEKRIDLIKTIRLGLTLWASAGSHAGRLRSHFERDMPDLLICDFEPLMPRAARMSGVPVLSLDHQHFMTTYDLGTLPKRLQRWAWLMGWSLVPFQIRQQKTVVSAFYKPPLKRGKEDVVQVGPLLRPAVRAREPVVGGHILTYLRRATPDRVIDALASLPLPVKIYGLGLRENRGNISFHEIDERTFLDDLSSADSVISAAGNQLLGEALYFGKPCLVMPEFNHHEQCINAHFLESMGYGEQQYLERVSLADMQSFLDNRATYRERLVGTADQFDGVEETATAIEEMLRQS